MDNYTFISYCAKNQNFADTLRVLFKSNNISSWMAPYDIPPGSVYANEIEKSIKNCSCFVLLLTKVAQESRHVHREVERAVNYGKTIIPIQLENMQLSGEFNYYLGTCQIIAVPSIETPSQELDKVIKQVKICIDSYHGENYIICSSRDKFVSTETIDNLGEGLDFQKSLSRLYDILVEYRLAIKNGEEIMIAKMTSALQSEIQRVYYFSERYRYSNKELACKATDIVSQYNKYVDPYNAFIESTDRMSEGAQQFALEAEQIFNELVNMVVKSLK